MVQMTVLKVDISCRKCKKRLLKAVSGLKGVDKVEADAAKGTLTVTGDCDPYDIIVRSRKAGKFAEVVSIGPPPAPPKPAEKKPEEKKPAQKPQQQIQYIPYYYGAHQNPVIVSVVEPCSYEHKSSCSVM